jgi:hypothetical protein
MLPACVHWVALMYAIGHAHDPSMARQCGAEVRLMVCIVQRRHVAPLPHLHLPSPVHSLKTSQRPQRAAQAVKQSFSLLSTKALASRPA